MNSTQKIGNPYVAKRIKSGQLKCYILEKQKLLRSFITRHLIPEKMLSEFHHSVVPAHG